MRRLRLLQVLLPLVLVLFVWLVVLAVRPRPTVRPSHEADELAGKGGRNVRITELEGGDTRLSGDIDTLRQEDDGTLTLEGIRELLLRRDEGSPLEISADLGDIAGPAGARTMVFESGVVIRDRDAGLTITLPRLEVDEALGEARSTSGLSVEGATLRGSAGGLVYGLAGQPSTLDRVAFTGADGLHLVADRAVLVDGLDDVELRGRVEITRGEERLRTERLRLERDSSGALRRARGDGGVDAALEIAPASSVDLSAERADVSWDGAGRVASLELTGGAIVRRGAESLAAESIRAERVGEGFHVDAERSVYVQGVLERGPAWLRSDRLVSVLTGALQLESGTASGRVRFEGPGTRAEAASATLGGADGDTLVLTGADLRRARLAQGRTRVTADRIATDRAGRSLDATGDVESTLLPAAEGGADGLALFRADEAIHFVSRRLVGRDSDGVLTFEGGVRAWQGERNLSADRVDLDERAGTLLAAGAVGSRFPRVRDAPAVRLENYVQIDARRLEYVERERRATYRDTVRVTVREGWLAGEVLDVLLEEAGGGIRETRATGSVTLEFRRAEDDGTTSVVTGSGDRVVWQPQASTVLLYGDATPAILRRLGVEGGTTSGRVLRYELDTGTIEVDSSDQGPARIRTSGGATR